MPKSCKDEPIKLDFYASNQGQLVDVEVTYRLYRAKDKSMKQLEDTPIIAGTAASNKEISLDWKDIPSGPYVEKEVQKQVQSFILFMINDRLFRLRTGILRVTLSLTPHIRLYFISVHQRKMSV